MACDEETLAAITTAINTALLGPKKVSGDAGSVEQHDIGEMIEADRYLRTRCVTESPRRGLRFTKLVPPGCD
jgi:hypothetical protein